jgi:hypothetical protein
MGWKNMGWKNMGRKNMVRKNIDPFKAQINPRIRAKTYSTA